MNIDFKNFDYTLLKIKREPLEVTKAKPDFVNSDIQYNFSNTESALGPIITVFSLIRVSFNIDTEIGVYKSSSIFRLPYQQNISRLHDKLTDIDDSVLAELLFKHISMQTMFIYEESEIIINTLSIYDAYNLIIQAGNAANN